MIAVQFLNTEDELLADAVVDTQDEPKLSTVPNAHNVDRPSEDAIIHDPLNNTPCEQQQNEEDSNPSTAIENCGEHSIKCSASDDVENLSPNSSMKRNLPDGTKLLKSSKKHASTEMKFRCFNINWEKISDNILDRLRALDDFKKANPGVYTPPSVRIAKTEITTLTNAIVDQLRTIDNQIRADIMETVARQVFNKFPALDYTDDDGFGAGQGYIEMKYKMINRNNYLNRFKSAQAPTANIDISLKKKRNARAGTLKEYWEKSSNKCDNTLISILTRDETQLLTDDFLVQTQSFVRYKLDEKVATGKMIAQLPVLRRRSLLTFHFEKATGVKIADLRRYFTSKRDKIIRFSLTCKTDLHLNNLSSDRDILEFLCSLVGENFGDLIVHKEVGTRIEDIAVDTSGPVLVAVDVGNGRTVIYVYANGIRVSEGASDVIAAMEDLFMIHFVHNFMYVKALSKFLELIQEYFLKIITFVASKSAASRVGQRQRKVRKVISALASFDVRD
ncbi:uncharacterized protein LOC110676863 [Aedes aegypti]|uniref:Uncharacterized protein n=1 Tax=Aedes aegypti TaxID=7159 RepID=A0A6I8TS53_AEDAE|nr:uncharacterized protein LOC110676863 [Aedes aegypti]